MGSNRHHRTISLVLGTMIIIMVILAGYFTISDLAGKQSQKHQQSMSPVFSLIEKELIKPLQIAATLAEVGIYDKYLLSKQPNKDEVVKELDKYSKKFNLQFYLAHERSRQQFNSDGRVFDLVEGKVIWYFALKEQTDYKVQAVLGQRDDVHLYIDVRQYDAFGNFLGFVGVGKSLSDFINSFASFREEYGHEFVFVNNNDEIVLSSLPDLSPKQALSEDERIGIKSTAEISWFNEFTDKITSSTEQSAVVSDNNSDLLVSKLTLESLNWNLYILTPLESRQQAVNESFALYIGIGLVILIILYQILYKFIDEYTNKISRRINRDSLTNLANSDYANFYFNRQRKRSRQMAVISCDLDYFKTINENYGRNAGDKVLAEVASCFDKLIDDTGLVARWDGEEFAIILPEMDAQEAEQVAKLCRKSLQALRVPFEGSDISVTGSFGIFASRQHAHNLNKMMDQADKALSKAKNQGKNKVVTAFS
ncbi:GGDEF domain-containing protein [Glaciecola sp. 2405UD65-10]|uniref:GGDEF domain-containing protein n=1 Tax=Glaciecola sp. 2405UD65-10 TaxID=3397244 RepID=UPI003B5A18EC